MLLLVAAALWHDARHKRDGSWNPSGARAGHEESILLRTIVTLLLITPIARRFAPDLPAPDSILPSMLVLALIAGMSLRRFTRVATVQAWA